METCFLFNSEEFFPLWRPDLKGDVPVPSKATHWLSQHYFIQLRIQERQQIFYSRLEILWRFHKVSIYFRKAAWIKHLKSKPVLAYLCAELFMPHVFLSGLIPKLTFENKQMSYKQQSKKMIWNYIPAKRLCSNLPEHVLGIAVRWAHAVWKKVELLSVTHRTPISFSWANPFQPITHKPSVLPHLHSFQIQSFQKNSLYTYACIYAFIWTSLRSRSVF